MKNSSSQGEMLGKVKLSVFKQCELCPCPHLLQDVRSMTPAETSHRLGTLQESSLGEVNLSPAPMSRLELTISSAGAITLQAINSINKDG